MRMISSAIFGVLFGTMFVAFALWPPDAPQKANGTFVENKMFEPLAAIMTLFFFKFLMEVNVLKKEDIVGIKRILITIIFPVVVYKQISSIERSELKDNMIYALIGTIYNLSVFFICGGTVLLSEKFGIFSMQEALGVAISMGSIATNATALPFAMMVGGECQKYIAIIDITNKVWSLGILCILVNVKFSRGTRIRDLLCEIMCSLVKSPVIWGFAMGSIFVLAQWKITDLKASGALIEKNFVLLCKPLTMIFIGMKMTIPNAQNLKTFFPIFLRRAVSFFFCAAVITILNLGLDGETTVILFANGATSMWAYVHMAPILANSNSIVDLDFLMQFISYDYTIAVFSNVILSMHDIRPHLSPLVLTMIGVVYLIIAIAFALLSKCHFAQSRIEEKDQETKSVTI